MVRLSGQRGVPVITVDGQVIVGFDEPRLEALLSRGPRRAALGLAVADAATYAPGQRGAYIGRVHPASAAERAGLRARDIIIELAGRQVESGEDLQAIGGTLAPATPAPVVWRRDGQVMRGQIIL
jgi:S1-C subfamily serine protease